MKKSPVLILFVFMANLSIAQWSTSGTSVYTTSTTTRIGIGSTGSTITADLDLFRSQAGPTIIKVRNQSNLSGASARFDLSTYTANAYQISALYDNGGSPFYQFSVGPAVVVAYHDAPEFMWRNAAGTTNYMKITSSGKVGIGTINPGSYKLAVEGTIGTRAIVVTTVTPFPDYVFNPGYALRSIRDVENYISQHKHLPGIPSTKDVEDAGGFELGEMNKKLLEKVEELTLYIIELNKRIEQLEQQK